MARLKKLSAFSEVLCAIGIVFFLLEQAYTIHTELVVHAGTRPSIDTVSAPSDWSLGRLLTRLPFIAAVICSLWFTRQIFSSFRRGEIITVQTVCNLRNIALAVLAIPFAHFVIPFLGAAPAIIGTGNYDIRIEATEMDLILLVLGIMFYTLSVAFSEAQARARDFELIF